MIQYVVCITYYITTLYMYIYKYYILYDYRLYNIYHI